MQSPAQESNSPNTPHPTTAPTWSVSSFYFFVNLEEKLGLLPQEFAQRLREAAPSELRGLFIVGPDGVNCSFATTAPDTRAHFEGFLSRLLKLPVAEAGVVYFKHSESEKPPFSDLKIKIRSEIVTTGAPELLPKDQGKHQHLTPEQWQAELQQGIAKVIDTRNWYESDIGTFRNAVCPPIENFTEFPDWMEQNFPNKDEKILMFCTGGIRCEKGLPLLESRGYKNVYQLQGGILNYLKELPNQDFIGECFVFDQRVAVDQHLQPSQSYHLCPHCGQPAKESLACGECNRDAYVCARCRPTHPTCSKNCNYHHQRKASAKN